MQVPVHGAFHFHSTYSHDGRTSLPDTAAALRRRGLSFCIMTDHFEDFDAAKFQRYLGEVNVINGTGEFVMVPGVEVNIAGIDTILFPVTDFAECQCLASQGNAGGRRLYKVVAHPTKYPFDAVLHHLGRFGIDAIELWNQQTDGGYMPPLGLLDSFRTHPRRNQYHYLFGCDLHDAGMTVTNTVSVAGLGRPTLEAVVAELSAGRFSTSNDRTGIEYRNGPGGTEFDGWLESTRKRPYAKGRALRAVRVALRALYMALPRHARHSLNDFKNAVRNRV